MASITLNFGALINELAHTDIKSLVKNTKNQSKIINDWNRLLEALGQASEKLAKGEQIGAELASIRHLATSLGGCVVEFGSMLPGPIGIACSLGLAIACLIPPFDILGFVLNLMGCIPFAKAGLKTAKPLIENLIREALKSPIIKGGLRAGHDVANKVVRYNGEYAKSMYLRLVKPSLKKAETTLSHTPNANPNSKIASQSLETKYYLHEGGNVTPKYDSPYFPEILHKGNQEVRRYQLQPRTIQGNPVFNPFTNL